MKKHSSEYRLVWDVGGSGIKATIIGQSDEIVCRWREPLPKSYEEFKEQLLNSCRQKEQEFSIGGTALSLPVKVDFLRQQVLGYGSVPYLYGRTEVSSELSSLLGMPVVFENDARCAALGDCMRDRINSSRQRRVYIICGTGIGGAVVENGTLCGNGVSAPGEWGSLYAGGTEENSIFFGKAASVGAALKQIHRQTGVLYSGEEIFDRADNGEQPFEQVVSKFYFYLCALAYNLHATYLPDEIVFGGAISQRTGFLEKLRARMETSFSYSIKNGLTTNPMLCVCKDGNDANLYGAAYLLIVFMKGKN